MSADIESQFDEISALESIFNEEEISVVKENGVYSGQLFAYVPVPQGFTFKYKDLRDPEDEMKSIPVSHLPPISLAFELPHDYPSSSAPTYRLSCPWLTFYKMHRLCCQLDSLWKDNIGMAILFTWMNFLKLESLEYLSIEDSLNISNMYTRDLRFAACKLNNLRSQCDYVNGPEKEDCAVKNVENNKSVLNENKDCHIAPELQKKCLPQQQPSRANCSNFNPNSRKANRKQRTSKCDNRLKNKRTKSQHFVHADKIITTNAYDLLQTLLRYDEDRTLVEFKKSFFPCEICFESQVGSKCTQFKPCNHVYCNQCVYMYFETRIKENTIQSMPCPHEGCNSEASQIQVRDIVGTDLFRRYDSQLLAATLDTMTDIVYCPRKACQTPVLLELPERMAICPNCRFAFCAFCKMTYHGVEQCKLKIEEKRALALEYEKSDAEAKARMEARYGKKQLTTLLQNVQSADWISENSKSCPSCSASIEKSDGCNKMVCGKCNTIFCWLCRCKLDPAVPYKHFYDLKSDCHNLLFEGLQGAGDEDFDLDFLEDDDDEEDEEFYVFDEENIIDDLLGDLGEPVGYLEFEIM